MSDNDLIQNLCGTWCSYYKPGKDEELACKGFIVVKQMMRNMVTIPFEKPDESDQARQLLSDSAARLASSLCPVCSFSAEDCDFADRLEGARPCGGFLLLMQFMEKKTVNIDDIRQLL
ncbi:MAG: hypothetical protein JSV13_01670 [Nitrospiraceae bacterium]|jgi:hypothetical protein|nr:MAG: hypothetical protein JSV13_01670 [Nitrospiraceae bacterium]